MRYSVYALANSLFTAMWFVSLFYVFRERALVSLIVILPFTVSLYMDNTLENAKEKWFNSFLFFGLAALHVFALFALVGVVSEELLYVWSVVYVYMASGLLIISHGFEK